MKIVLEFEDYEHYNTVEFLIRNKGVVDFKYLNFKMEATQ